MKLLSKYSLILLPLKGFLRNLSFTSPQNPTFANSISIRGMVNDKPLYYMEESVLLGTKPLVDYIRHFIRDPSGVFSVCHLCECRIVQ